jgi:ATP-binding cassette subfamily F protein 2
MSGELSPIDGSVQRHPHLKIGKYNQHSADQLDNNVSAIDYLRSKFPEQPQDISHWRAAIGRFGLTGSSQLCPISQLSDGQKARIVFCELSLATPNMLLLGFIMLTYR